MFCIEGGEYSHVMARCFLLVRGHDVVACPRRGHALYTQFSVCDGAKTVTFPTSCVSALRLCALWSILLSLTQCPNSKRCHEEFFGQFFRWGGCLKCGACRGGFWLHRRRRSRLCSVCWCGWGCVAGSSGSQMPCD